MNLLSLVLAATATTPGQPPVPPAGPVTAVSNPAGSLFDATAGPTVPGRLTPPPPSYGPESRLANSTESPLAAALSTPERGLFESDHAFDGFTNPVSNPVLSKDPRSNTWVRFLFVNNNFPGAHPFGGGNAQVYAMQVNVALTERLTFIADKDGYSQITPRVGSRTSGWLDLAAGLKYTLIRDVENQFLFTAGLMYEAPSGAAQVFQSQGSGIFTPFVTYGKQFADHWHFIGTHGFSFAVDPSQNSSFFYHSLHLDREIGGWFYPLVELNWFQYTQGGNLLPRAIGEGDGLLNLGTQGMNGRQLLTTAIGARFKITEGISAGAAYEFPLSNYKGILNNRVTADLVLRY